MGGWYYAMIMDAGSDNASSATRVVRLPDSRGQAVRGGVRLWMNRAGVANVNRLRVVERHRAQGWHRRSP